MINESTLRTDSIDAAALLIAHNHPALGIELVGGQGVWLFADNPQSRAVLSTFETRSAMVNAYRYRRAQKAARESLRHAQVLAKRPAYMVGTAQVSA